MPNAPLPAPQGEGGAAPHAAPDASEAPLHPSPSGPFLHTYTLKLSWYTMHCEWHSPPAHHLCHPARPAPHKLLQARAGCIHPPPAMRPLSHCTLSLASPQIRTAPDLTSLHFLHPERQTGVPHPLILSLHSVILSPHPANSTWQLSHHILQFSYPILRSAYSTPNPAMPPYSPQRFCCSAAHHQLALPPYAVPNFALLYYCHLSSLLRLRLPPAPPFLAPPASSNQSCTAHLPVIQHSFTAPTHITTGSIFCA